MSSALDITKSVNPPRAVFLDFPLGHTAGKPNEPDLQIAIMLETLAGFTEFTQPGMIKTLPFRWSDDETWKDRAQRGDDERIPRYDTPQYQSEEDRIRAEATGAVACPTCATAH